MPLRAFFVFPQHRAHRRSQVLRLQFQCPYGHSLFFHDLAAPQLWAVATDVSMPLRAFFVFPLDTRQEMTQELLEVSMPLRAFFVFPHLTAEWLIEESMYVSMPLRAFFVFPPFAISLLDMPYVSFNALTGILCFSTQKELYNGCKDWASFNALTGILCFSTGPGAIRSAGWWLGFNALTGILCFSTMFFSQSWLCFPFLFQCPYGHSLFFHASGIAVRSAGDQLFQCPYGHSLFFHAI